MKKLLFGLLAIVALIATGCSDVPASKSGEKIMKCGADKKCSGEKKDEKTMKCGEGKCGGNK